MRGCLICIFRVLGWKSLEEFGHGLGVDGQSVFAVCIGWCVIP